MQDGYAADYLAVLFASIVPVVLLAGALITSWVLAPKVRTGRMAQTYECGMPPIGQFWSQVHVRYYLFAILFLVFDVEAVFLFPWAIVFRGGGLAFFVEMMVFVAILMFGLLYAWRKGLLRWT